MPLKLSHIPFALISYLLSDPSSQPPWRGPVQWAPHKGSLAVPHLGRCPLLPALGLTCSSGVGCLHETMNLCIQDLEMWETLVGFWDEG